MPSLLAHALSASAVQGLVCMASFGQSINESVFCAAVVAILVDLDHRSDGKRSAAVHSLFAVLLGSLVLMVSVEFLSGVQSIMLAVSIDIGLTTHVLLDMSDPRGVFVVPWRSRRITTCHRRKKARRPKGQRKNLLLVFVSGSVLLVLVCI